MTVEEKALALVNEALVESGWECFSLAIAQTRYDYGFEALCRAIEAHEADKNAFSDAITAFWPTKPAPEHFQRFILPDPEPDPLVEALANVPDDHIHRIAESKDVAVCRSRIADALRGYKIERIEQ